MKKFTLLIASCLAFVASYGQTAIQYGFSAATGTYSELSSPTVLGAATTTNGATSLDDVEYRVTFPAGFTFSYEGTAQTALNIDSNGYVGFGTVAWTGYTYAPLSTNPSGGTTSGLISAFGADLNAYASTTASPGSISWQVEGTGNDQVFVVQYKNFKSYENSDTVDRLLNFQIRLYSSAHTLKPNYIEIAYGTTNIGDSASTGVDVGIRSAATGWAANVNNVMIDNVPAGTACKWINAVTANNNSNGNYFSTGNTSITIPEGLVYTYYPQSASGPNPVRTFAATTFTTSTAILTWTAPTNATQYNIQYRVTGSCDWVNWTGNPVTGTTVTLTGLTELTSYQVRVQASNGTTNSVWSHIPNTAGGGNGYVAAGTFTTLASCIEPTALTAGTTTTTSASYSFTASVTAPASGYDYYYSTTNTAPTATTTPSGNVAGTSISLTGLTANTTYYLWVRSKCSETSNSVWTASATFTTPCDATDIPYTQNFESATTPAIPACTSILNAGTGNNWTTVNNPGYGFATKTLRYSYSSANAANAWFFTQGLNLTAGVSYRINYTYGNDSTFYTEKLKVAYGTGTTVAAMNVVATYNTVNTGAATTTFTDFTPATSGVYYIGFNAFSAANQDYLFVDNISVVLTPACDLPTAVTGVTTGFTTGTINWAAPATAPASGYEYYYSATNTAPVAETTASGSVGAGITTANITGLTANTTYYVWVRSVCSATAKSPWVGPGSFYTGYCTPAPTSVDGIGITNVTFGTINNTTTDEAGHYGNYTAMSSSAAAGSTVSFSITYSTGYTYGTKIWIDWNNDADFTDAGELVYTGLSTNADPTTLSGTFAVPASASVVGSHRVRIGGTDNDAGGDPCYSSTYGTFEDYTLNVFMPDAPAITAFTPAAYCAANGVITITGTSLGNATLAIGGTAVVLTTNTNTQITATVPAGVSGTVSVTTVAGNATTTDVFAVTAPPAITVTPATAICAGQSTVLTASSTNANYTYSWMPGNLTGASQTVSPTATTTYTVTATDPAGCVVAQTVTVTVNAVPSPITVAASGSTVCSGTIVPLVATGGTIGGTATTGTATTLTTATEQPTAFNNRWSTYTMQTIYTAAELNAAGLTAGSITSMAYNITTLGDAATNANYTVKIGTVSGSTFANTNFLATTGFTTVYGPQTYTHTASGLQTITFATPYVWDGTSNIVVSVTSSGANATNNSQTYYTTTTGNTVLWANSTTATTGTLSPKRLNVTFITNIPTTLAWSPATNLYTNATATTPYVAGTAANTVYFKSTTGGASAYTVTSTSVTTCATTATVNVNVNLTPAPTGTATQAICWSGTVANIAATGENLKYYSVATGGTALAATTAIAAGTYYVSQTLNNCESPERLAVAVTITTVAAPAIAQTVVNFCNSGTVAQLNATGAGIQWYASVSGGTPLAATTAFTEGTSLYYASQTLDGCESQMRTAVAVVLTITDAPVATATQTFCTNATGADLTANGSAVQWYTAATGGTAITGTTALENGVTYYASQTINNCESAERVAVAVVINVTDAPVAAAEQTFCNAGMVSGLASTGTEVQWYTAATGGTAISENAALVNGVYYASQTVNGCESATRTAVTVTVNSINAPVATTIQNFCGQGVIGGLSATGTAVAWYDTATGGGALADDVALVNGMIYYASQTVNGCESATRTPVAVTITTVVVDAPEDVTTCNSYTLPALTNGAYYTGQNGTGDVLAAGTVVNQTTTLYIYAQAEGTTCSDENWFIVTINSTDAPTGEASQTVEVETGGSATIEDLVVTATGTVTWYASEADALAGTNPLVQGTEVTAGTTYYATQTNGDCTSITALAVTVTEILGGKVFNARSFSYYPNPVKDVLNVSYSSDITSVTVFNLLGQQVLGTQPNATTATIDMAKLAEGTYIVNVTAGNAVKTIKVVIKH